MHEAFMRRCLALAEQGRGRVGNGALVGAVLARGETILAESFHESFGSSHAEFSLLRQYEQNISSKDTLYVNLEPCCHQGKTPPCTTAILERGIKKVVFGMLDPDSRVAGKGIALLKKAGVNVIGPVLEDECLRLNRGFVSVRTLRRPWITLKRAQTIHGDTAAQSGGFLKITDALQDTWSHTYLRAWHDAILVGIHTVLSDNPRLTVRDTDLQQADRERSPIRIVFDPTCSIPLTARLLDRALRTPTIIVVATNTDIAPSKMAALLAKGARIFPCPMKGDRFSWKHLWSVLTTPNDDFHGITSILVEGGLTTWNAFHQEYVVDQEVTLVGR
jgi:diaminohydroxyphosphoribosylaminopyrimidine deaminase / 5-amino-6-(5-phosphoribosylamino)uracil reductase